MVCVLDAKWVGKSIRRFSVASCMLALAASKSAVWLDLLGEGTGSHNQQGREVGDVFVVGGNLGGQLPSGWGCHLLPSRAGWLAAAWGRL
eukprot:4934930-Pyramimonas_sp.AAC.1